MRKNGRRRAVTAVLLALSLAGCAAPMSPAEIDAQAKAFVDEIRRTRPLCGPDPLKRLESMSPPLQRAIFEELMRRTVADVEGVDELVEAGEPAPFDSFASSWALLFDEDPVRVPLLVDFVVWAGAHAGRADICGIWNLGTRAIPPLLKLRGDRHRVAHVAMAKSIARFAVSKDPGIAPFSADELRRCPEAVQPHHRAILAASGDRAQLAAIPELLDADQPADRIFALALVPAMFGAAAPFGGDACDGKDADVASMVDKTLAWWARNAEIMSFDSASGRWRLTR